MAEWDIDLSEVNGLRQWYKTRPKLMQKASAMLLNNFAFGVRTESTRQIAQLMTVRNERFVSSRLKVTKTHGNRPIAQQRSITGSVAGPRFSGWVEQELGKATDRQRVSTLASRNGDLRRQMLPRTRLKRGNEVTTIAAKAPKGGVSNYGGFIAMLARQGYKGLIRIKGGLYVIGRGKQALAGPTRGGSGLFKQLQLVQEFKRVQPKQKHWLRKARAVYFKKNPPGRTWAQTVGRLMTPPPKRG